MTRDIYFVRLVVFVPLFLDTLAAPPDRMTPDTGIRALFRSRIEVINFSVECQCVHFTILLRKGVFLAKKKKKLFTPCGRPNETGRIQSCILCYDIQPPPLLFVRVSFRFRKKYNIIAHGIRMIATRSSVHVHVIIYNIIFGFIYRFANETRIY